MNADKANALRCAVEVLSGEGGGYSGLAKYRSKIILWNMLMDEEGTPEKHMAIPDDLPVQEEKPLTAVYGKEKAISDGG